MKSCRASVPHQVVHRTLASETVLLNIDSGFYYGMDETGGRFFEVMTQAPSLAAAFRTLTGEFDAPEEQIRLDMLRYCSELVEHGLIELQATGLKSHRGS